MSQGKIHNEVQQSLVAVCEQLSCFILRRHGNLFNKIISDDNLRLALRNACRSNGRSSPAKRRNVQDVRNNPEKWLCNLRERLLKFHTSSYTCFPLFDPKLRFIYSLPFVCDRLVHHALLNVLAPIWNNLMFPFSFACRENKGQHLAGLLCAQYVRKYKYVAQFDISQFYVSLNHSVLKQILRKKIKDTKVLAILDEIIDSVSTRDQNLKHLYKLKAKGLNHPDINKEIAKLELSKQRDNSEPAGVPVGSYTSQWFGNLYLNENDTYLVHQCKCKAIVRYCDDFLIFSNDKKYLQEIKSKEATFLWNNLHLILSKAEIFPTNQGVDFCGYRYFPNSKVLLRKRTMRRQAQNLKQIKSDFDTGAITKEQARSKIASMDGWLKWAMCHHWKLKNNFYTIKSEILNAQV